MDDDGLDAEKNRRAIADARRKQSGEQPTNFSNDHFKEFDRFYGHTDAFKTKTCLTAKI